MTPADTLQFLQTIITLVSSFGMIFLAEPVINRMSPCTRFLPRLAFHLLTVGGFIHVVMLIGGHRPATHETIMAAGVAMLLSCDWLRRFEEHRR